MSKLDELIQQLCPDGVEFKPLGEVCEILDNLRRPVAKDNRNKGIYPYYGANGIQDFVEDYIFDGTFLLMGEDGSVINEDKSPVLNWAVGKIWVNNHAHIFKETVLIKLRFVYYYLQTIDVSSIVRGVPPKLNQANLRNIAIPLPPLPVQEEIVRLLDQLTETTQKYQAELEAELDVRKKQYEEYRNQLLTFDATRTDVERTKISDICLNICSGGTPSTSHEEYYHGNIPWLRTQEVDWKEINDTEIKITDDAIANSSAKIIPANCVIVAMYGATAAKAAINKIPLSTNQACCNLEIDSNKALYRYVYQWFCKEYDKLKAMGEGSQNNINGKKVKDYPISLPPLTEQERIVNILDRMDKTHKELCQSIETEIKMRKQQYEYYRNQLLEFKKKEE